MRICWQADMELPYVSWWHLRWYHSYSRSSSFHSGQTMLRELVNMEVERLASVLTQTWQHRCFLDYAANRSHPVLLSEL